MASRRPAPTASRRTATLNVADTTADGSYEVEIEFATDDDPAQTATCTVTVTVSDLDAVTPSAPSRVTAQPRRWTASA